MAKKSEPAKTRIPKDQMDLPVTFDCAGKPLTLRQMMNGQAPAASLAELTADKKAELTATRIEAQPKFEIAIIGGGVVSKDRAVEEVKAQTDIGKSLIEIEERVIRSLLAAVEGR
jgi:hypothetical protein